MKKSTGIFVGIGVVVLIVVFWFFGTRNSFVSLKEDV